MTTVLVEENPSHIDDESMRDLLRELRELGHEAESTEQTTVLKAAWWVLVVQVSVGLPGAVAAGVQIASWAARWFKSRGQDPPRRVDLYGPDGEFLKSVPVPDE
jgi:hypothetical protein